MVLDEIISIKKVGKHKTVDIEVDGDHFFFCNGILVHNSASGDVADVSEENVQGGIAKIQSADNVLAFIPSSIARETGVLKAKLLKTRDSAGVGNSVYFKPHWPTLTFEPWVKEDGNYSQTDSTNNTSKSSPKKSEKTFTKKPTLKRTPKKVKAVAKSNSEEKDESPAVSPTSVIRGIKGKRTTRKKVKMT
jgi:hypothetical protein